MKPAPLPRKDGADGCFIPRVRIAVLIVYGFLIANAASGTAPEPLAPRVERVRPGLLMIHSYPKFYSNAAIASAGGKPCLQPDSVSNPVFRSVLNGWSVSISNCGEFAIGKYGNRYTTKLADIGVMAGGDFVSAAEGEPVYARWVMAGGKIQWSNVFQGVDVRVSLGYNEILCIITLKPSFKSILRRRMYGRVRDARDGLALIFENEYQAMSGAVLSCPRGEAAPGECFQFTGPLRICSPGGFVYSQSPARLVFPAEKGAATALENQYRCSREQQGDWDRNITVHRASLNTVLDEKYRNQTLEIHAVSAVKGPEDWCEAVCGGGEFNASSETAVITAARPLYVKPGLSGMPGGLFIAKAELMIYQTRNTVDGNPELFVSPAPFDGINAPQTSDPGGIDIPALEKPVRAGVCPPDGGNWLNLDITDAFTRMYGDQMEYGNHGGLVVGLDEDAAGSIHIQTSNAAAVHQRPRIVLRYARPVAITADGGARLYKNENGVRERIFTCAVDPPIAGVPVCFELLDPDDPATHPDIDPNGNLGNDNGMAVCEVNPIRVLTDSNGLAATRFSTKTRMGGDNYQVAAYAGGMRIESDIYTVWNRMHIEYDVMEDTPPGFLDYGPPNVPNRSHRIHPNYLYGPKRGLASVLEACNDGGFQPDRCAYVTPVIHETNEPCPFYEFVNIPKLFYPKYHGQTLDDRKKFHLIAGHLWDGPPAMAPNGGYTTWDFSYILWDKIQYCNPAVDEGLCDNLWIIAHELGHALLCGHHEIHGEDDVTGLPGHDCVMTQAAPPPALNVFGQYAKRFGPKCVRSIRDCAESATGVE